MTIHSLLVLALALLGSLPVPAAHADPNLAPPTIVKEGDGTFRIDFTTPNVLDLSSDWVHHDDKGRLAGNLLDTDGAEFQVVHAITGSCKYSRGVTTVKQRIVSEGVVGGGDVFRSVSNFEGTIVGYGSAAQLVGHTSIKSCLRQTVPFGKKKFTVCNITAEDPVVSKHDGRWSIRLVFDNDGKHLIGGAEVYTGQSNPKKAKSYSTSVSGKLDPDGEANFKLVPLDKHNGIGGTIKLRALVIPRSGDNSPELVEILEVGGKVLGQSFAEVY